MGQNMKSRLKWNGLKKPQLVVWEACWDFLYFRVQTTEAMPSSHMLFLPFFRVVHAPFKHVASAYRGQYLLVANTMPGFIQIIRENPPGIQNSRKYSLPQQSLRCTVINCASLPSSVRFHGIQLEMKRSEEASASGVGSVLGFLYFRVQTTAATPASHMLFLSFFLSFVWLLRTWSMWHLHTVDATILGSR